MTPNKQENQRIGMTKEVIKGLEEIRDKGDLVFSKRVTLTQAIALLRQQEQPQSQPMEKTIGSEEEIEKIVFKTMLPIFQKEVSEYSFKIDTVQFMKIKELSKEVAKALSERFASPRLALPKVDRAALLKVMTDTLPIKTDYQVILTNHQFELFADAIITYLHKVATPEGRV